MVNSTRDRGKKNSSVQSFTETSRSQGHTSSASTPLLQALSRHMGTDEKPKTPYTSTLDTQDGQADPSHQFHLPLPPSLLCSQTVILTRPFPFCSRHAPAHLPPPQPARFQTHCTGATRGVMTGARNHQHHRPQVTLLTLDPSRAVIYHTLMSFQTTATPNIFKCN